MNVKAIVLRAPGTNCDQETAFALEQGGADAEILHIWKLIENPRLLRKTKILVIPGGFSYGDDIAAGKLMANELKLKMKDQLEMFIKSGRLILGICNGFQVLTSMGLLPATEGGAAEEAALVLNDSSRFEDRWVHLAFNEKSPSPLKDDDPVNLPVAHGEGKLVTMSPDVLNRLIKQNQVVAQYVDEEGELAGYPHNPNGSVKNIAALCNPSGNVMGLMPHPERYLTGYQHPQWTRSKDRRKAEGDGLRLFQRLVYYARKHA